MVYLLQMVIFHGYVKQKDGIPNFHTSLAPPGAIDLAIPFPADRKWCVAVWNRGFFIRCPFFEQTHGKPTFWWTIPDSSQKCHLTSLMCCFGWFQESMFNEQQILNHLAMATDPSDRTTGSSGASRSSGSEELRLEDLPGYSWLPCSQSPAQTGWGKLW